ncbi:hypothetical protein [Thermococcus guaymasensis]|nr:hypothetical protein [Thermococcus guaymasensis]
MRTMDSYTLVMSANGLLVLVGIFLTWHLTRLVERYRLGKEKLSWLLLLGGLVTALGFIGDLAGLYVNDARVLVILGSALIVYALSMSGLVGAKLEMLFQIGLIVLSAGVSGNPKAHIVLVFSDISLLLLMNAVAFYSNSPVKSASMARLSAWLLVAFTLVNALYPRSVPTIMLYTASVSLWVVSLLLSYPRARVLNSAQEGL